MCRRGASGGLGGGGTCWGPRHCPTCDTCMWGWVGVQSTAQVCGSVSLGEGCASKGQERGVWGVQVAPKRG